MFIVNDEHRERVGVVLNAVDIPSIRGKDDNVHNHAVDRQTRS